MAKNKVFEPSDFKKSRLVKLKRQGDPDLIDIFHKEYARVTRQFLAKCVQKGMNWRQCHEIIEFGDDEVDEDIINPVTNNPEHYLTTEGQHG